MEGLSRIWWGRILIALLMFAFCAFMVFAVPAGGKFVFDVCRFTIAVVPLGLGIWFLVSGWRMRNDRRS
jgi:hypothetical protein